MFIKIWGAWLFNCLQNSNYEHWKQRNGPREVAQLEHRRRGATPLHSSVPWALAQVSVATVHAYIKQIRYQQEPKSNRSNAGHPDWETWFPPLNAEERSHRLGPWHHAASVCQATGCDRKTHPIDRPVIQPVCRKTDNPRKSQRSQGGTHPDRVHVLHTFEFRKLVTLRWITPVSRPRFELTTHF